MDGQGTDRVTEFKAGDLVRLATKDGPLMTVFAGTGDIYPRPSMVSSGDIGVAWWENQANTICRDFLPPGCLRKQGDLEAAK